MRIVFERPPMFDEINAKFHIAGKPIIFSWGDVIYNPLRVTIPPHLMVHEKMHGWRQHDRGVENWWENYIASTEFRLQEEVLAHQVEYRSLLQQGNNRSTRRQHLKRVAMRLSSRMYGRMITLAEAKSVLREAAAI